MSADAGRSPRSFSIAFGPARLHSAFGNMKARRKIVGAITLVMTLLAITAICVVVPQLRKLEEFGIAESVKGHWASLQDFQKEHGRYPTNEAEIASFFHIAEGTAPVHFVPPHDDGADEPILWWKEKTRSGVTVGITEAGAILKK